MIQTEYPRTHYPNWISQNSWSKL